MNDTIFKKIFLILGLIIGAFIFVIDFFLIGYILSLKYFSKKREKKVKNMGLFDKFLLTFLIIVLSIGIFPFGCFTLGWITAQRSKFKNIKDRHELEAIL